MPRVYVTDAVIDALAIQSVLDGGHLVSDRDEDGRIWLDDDLLERIESHRKPDESISDVILRMYRAY